jgi:hypothetical protein
MFRKSKDGTGEIGLLVLLRSAWQGLCTDNQSLWPGWPRSILAPPVFLCDFKDPIGRDKAGYEVGGGLRARILRPSAGSSGSANEVRSLHGPFGYCQLGPADSSISGWEQAIGLQAWQNKKLNRRDACQRPGLAEQGVDTPRSPSFDASNQSAKSCQSGRAILECSFVTAQPA